MQFQRNKSEEEVYKRELGILLSLVQKCENSIEDLKELSNVEGMSDAEYKARQNIIMKFRISQKDLTLALHSVSSQDKRAKAADNEDLLGFEEPGYEQQNSKWENTDNMFHEQAQLKKETDAMGNEIGR